MKNPLRVYNSRIELTEKELVFEVRSVDTAQSEEHKGKIMKIYKLGLRDLWDTI